jgi:hypothetical protein
MMHTNEEEFDHIVSTVMTVGDLRDTLTSMPADMPLRFITAGSPGSTQAGKEQVAFAASAEENCWDAQTRSTYTGFVVELEFPPGRYYRTKDI